MNFIALMFVNDITKQTAEMNEVVALLAVFTGHSYGVLYIVLYECYKQNCPAGACEGLVVETMR
jgi:hypothetical protein